MGMIHCGVRWNSTSSPTWLASADTIWMADEPVPITPTRLPASSTPWSHRALWKGGAREVLQALEVRQVRVVQHAGGRDDEIAVIDRPVIERDPPAPLFIRARLRLRARSGRAA